MTTESSYTGHTGATVSVTVNVHCPAPAQRDLADWDSLTTARASYMTHAGIYS